MVVDRIGRLCASLARDPELRTALNDVGLPPAHWDTLVEAVYDGADPDVLTLVLDAIEEAAAAAGVDAITSGNRTFQPLPAAAPGFRTTHGWRCPHPHPCGRAEVRPGSGTPTCSLTADPLTLVKVVSG